MSVTSLIWRISSAGFSEQKLSGLSPGTFLPATDRLACSNKRATKEASFDVIVTGTCKIHKWVERGQPHVKPSYSMCRYKNIGRWGPLGKPQGLMSIFVFWQDSYQNDAEVILSDGSSLNQR